MLPNAHTISSQIHGWPDLSLGWRNQIPALLEMGFRVVAPDVMGYGRTDAPPVPPAESIKFYTFKRIADDLKTLANKLGCEKIFLGGHDWVSHFMPHNSAFLGRLQGRRRRADSRREERLFIASHCGILNSFRRFLRSVLPIDHLPGRMSAWRIW